MSFSEYVKRLVFVHKCVGCGEIQGYADYFDALCPKCKKAIERAKAESCPECARSVWECTCQPKLLSGAGSLCLSKLYFYHTDKENEPQNRLIYFLKRNRNGRVVDYAAGELLALIERESHAFGVELTAENAVFLGVPRSRRAIAEHGIDQSRELCLAMSRLCEIAFVPYFRRNRKAREQKKLNSAQRKQNMKQSLLGDTRLDSKLADKYVILVDDVVTSGAGMAACIDILRKKKIRGVFCCALSADFKKSSIR